MIRARSAVRTAAWTAAGAVAAAGLLALAARRGLLLTTVDGASMEPALRSGDRILVRRTRRVRRGQIALLHPADRPPATTLLLKRAVAVQGDRLPPVWADPDVARIGGTEVPRGSVVVLGDNRPTSWDSRHFGHVPREHVVGVMLCRLSPRRPAPEEPDAEQRPRVTRPRRLRFPA
ncbi:S26 family signal peptidase [Actinomadura kijaniata]|uniref:S26 family signal peptidase n=1 Tax=Actinomadura kijaniata TaxID=46161 RepID=UPI003F1B2E37